MKLGLIIPILVMWLAAATSGLAQQHVAPTPFADPLLSQRSVINLNFSYNTYDYAFIDHVRNQAGSIGPSGASYSSTPDPWPKLLDQDGYPNNAAASGIPFGGSINIPDSANFAGPYVITWDGDGQVMLASQTWTETTKTGKNYSKISNGRWANVAGKTAYVVINVSTSSGPKSVNLNVLTTGGSAINISSISWSQGMATATTARPHGRSPGDTLKLTLTGVTPSEYNGTFKATITGASTFTFALASNPGAGSGGNMKAYVTNIRFYRQEDEADLLAGKIFRSAWKQNFVDLNPSAIRFLNWLGAANGNDDYNNRFENRNLPSIAGFGGNRNFTVSPVYLDADGVTSPNHWTVAPATPTTSNPKTTPESMKHGEIVTTRIGAGGTMVRSGSQRVITSITNSTTPNVLATGHGFATGDKIVMNITSGMPALNRRVVMITVVDANNFSINVDTTSMGTFVSGYALQYVTLNVAGRGEYPITWTDGYTEGSQGGNFIVAGGYYTFYFDKTQKAVKDIAGNWITGVWMFVPFGSNAAPSGHQGDVPIEVCTALVNEVNEQSRAQAITNVVHMWMNLPAWGLDSNDPDYNAASNWPVNAVMTVLNGSTVDGVTYAGLDPRASLIVEYSNETWNFGTKQQAYVSNRAFSRWLAPHRTNTVDMHILRSVSAARDIKAATANSTRVRYTLGGQGAAGIGSSSINYLRINGSSTRGQGGNWYTTDPLVVNGNWGTPISNHDAFNTASYFDPIPIYNRTVTGTKTFRDDSAMYNGTDNSGNGGGNYTGAANRSQALTNFVNAVSTGAGQTIAQYVNILKPGYGSAPTLAGKVNIEYEGAHNWAVGVGQVLATGGPAMNSAQAAFALAAINSTQWKDALIGYFNSTAGIAGTAMPAMYYMLQNSGPNADQRWAYASPDSYAGGVEGQALLNNPVWSAAGARNRALTR